jgi:enoyl-CoA hydratase
MSEQREPTTVELIRDGNVGTLEFSTPSGVNVFCSSVLGRLGELVGHVREDSSLRFVVLRGKGRTFLAGADIEEMSLFDEPQAAALSRHGHHVFDAVEGLPQVTIAAISGHAMGGGCELAMACDFRVAVSSAKMGQPECKLGLIPGWGGTRRLTQLVGLPHARRLMFTGEPITAEQAERIGLVDEVVGSAEELDGALRRWFKRLSAGSPAAIKRIKHALLHGDEMNQFGLCFSCSDAREGMGAFLEKRQPSWAAVGATV